MNELTPYEQELAKKLNDINLPAEDPMWEEMKKLQQAEKDSRRRMLLLWLLLFLLFFAGIVWFAFHLNKNNSNKRVSTETNTSSNKLSKTGPAKGFENLNINKPQVKNNEGENNAATKTITKDDISATATSDSLVTTTNKDIASKDIPTTDNLSLNNNSKGNADNDIIKKQNNLKHEYHALNTEDFNNNNLNQNDKNDLSKSSSLKLHRHKNDSNDIYSTANSSDSFLTTTASQNSLGNKRPNKRKKYLLNRKMKTSASYTNSDADYFPNTTDTINVQRAKDILPLDLMQQSSLFANNIVARNFVILKGSATDSAKKKNNNINRKPWGIGITVQQAISLNPDNVHSTKTQASDYIPSLYVRWYGGKKWFIQAEAKYAAPQYINQSTYSVTVQTLPFNYVTTSYTLTKLYYSQALASFHYFILPNLSAGAGISYNIFSSADIREDVNKKLYGSANDSLFGSANFTGEKSSLSGIVKNNFNLLFEAQYKWKHFSLGMRYSLSLQPYIKYSDPFSGSPVQSNNYSLNAFLRYEFWNSKKKK